jgi:hypothetical protein
MMSGLAEVECAFVDAFFLRERLVWEDHVDQAGHDLAGVDDAMFQASKSLAVSESDLLRRVGVRGAIDYEPQVADLRNRVESREAYSDIALSRSGLAAAMEPDVVELMARRSELAHEAGFDSFGRLALWGERLDFDAAVRFVSDVRDAVIDEASEIASEEGLTVETWFEGLDRISGPADADMVESSNQLVAALGLQELASRLTWVIKDQPIFGVAGPIAVPDDVRLLLRPRGSQAGVVTAFHELGHGLAHAANRGTGIETTWDVVTDESMASIVEYAGVRLLLDLEARERQTRVELLETARMATSFLFEVAIDSSPSDVRRQYRDHYEPLVPVGDTALWAVDSFRSTDPFHIHSYLIGAEVADATLDHLTRTQASDPKRWGPWLSENLFIDGRRRTIISKLTDARVDLDESLKALAPT